LVISGIRKPPGNNHCKMINENLAMQNKIKIFFL